MVFLYRFWGGKGVFEAYRGGCVPVNAKKLGLVEPRNWVKNWGVATLEGGRGQRMCVIRKAYQGSESHVRLRRGLHNCCTPRFHRPFRNLKELTPDQKRRTVSDQPGEERGCVLLVYPLHSRVGASKACIWGAK